MSLSTAQPVGSRGDKDKMLITGLQTRGGATPIVLRLQTLHATIESKPMQHAQDTSGLLPWHNDEP